MCPLRDAHDNLPVSTTYDPVTAKNNVATVQYNPFRETCLADGAVLRDGVSARVCDCKKQGKAQDVVSL